MKSSYKEIRKELYQTSFSWFLGEVQTLWCSPDMIISRNHWPRRNLEQRSLHIAPVRSNGSGVCGKLYWWSAMVCVILRVYHDSSGQILLLVAKKTPILSKEAVLHFPLFFFLPLALFTLHTTVWWQHLLFFTCLLVKDLKKRGVRQVVAWALLHTYQWSRHNLQRVASHLGSEIQSSTVKFSNCVFGFVPSQNWTVM